MGEQTWWGWLKERIGSAGFRVFLWSISMSEEKYFKFLKEEFGAQR